MLKIIIPMALLIPTVWCITPKWMWLTTFIYALVIATLSLHWLVAPFSLTWSHLSPMMAVDSLSAPLLILSCWLLPLMILASMKHAKKLQIPEQRLYVSTLVLVQTFVVMAFSVTELLLFYIMFEATIIPTLLLITRWGPEADRLGAGLYFIFYTLATSLPLLIGLIALQNQTFTLSLLILQHLPLQPDPTYYYSAWAISIMAAFLAKMPMFGVHLWLPKAHVEAPIAGSMVLAGVLLKLGGYGLMRVMYMLHPLIVQADGMILAPAFYGLVAAALGCLQQTDMKKIIAYSSVAHMALVIGAILSYTPWGFSGALALMVAHGLTSSALFCLANILYERTKTRAITFPRALQPFMIGMSAWWFFACLANLAMPPLPNLMGEMLIITSLVGWSPWTILLTGASAIITAAYTLYLFLSLQRGRPSEALISFSPIETREHLLIALHLLPLLLLILKPEVIM